jgi:hypothetical protein
MKKILLFLALVFSFNTNAQAPENGLVAYYGFENNGNSHNGLYNLSNLHSSGTSVTYSTGANGIGSSAQFNNTAFKTSAISSAISNTFTICFWQKNSAPQGQNYASRFEMFGSAFYRNPGNVGQWAEGRISVVNGTWIGPAMQVQMTNDNWQHIAITYNTSGVYQIWINGVANSTYQYNAPFANLIKYNQILSIGAGADGGGNYMTSKSFVGNIDEFYVYDRALNSAEINQVKDDINGVGPSFGVVTTDALFQNTNAQITNVINPNNINATVYMLWGDSPAMINSASVGTISGTVNQTFVTNLMGLTPSSTYYYQLAFDTGGVTTYSPMYSFNQSMVTAFRFNNSFMDESGTVYLGPGPSGTYPSYVPDRAGNPNSAVFLENYKALVSGALPTLPTATSKRSVSFWFKRARTTTVERQSIFQWGTETTGNAYGVTIDEQNTVTNYGWSADVTSTTQYPSTTNWDHYVVTFSDIKIVSIYKNGVLIKNGLQPWNTIGNVLRLGSTTGGGLTNIYGHLDDFEIYNTVLSPTQVNNLYVNGNALLGTSNFQTKNLKAKIYPNPTSDNFSIEMNNEIKSVEIYSLQGQKVLSSKDKNVNVSNLSKGIYLVKIEDVENAIATQKLIIE